MDFRYLQERSSSAITNPRDLGVQDVSETFQEVSKEFRIFQRGSRGFQGSSRSVPVTGVSVPGVLFEIHWVPKMFQVVS